MSASTLNIVGCGRLGQAIAKLALTHNLVGSISVCNRSLESGQRAVLAVGSGEAFASIEEMPEASLWLIGTNDKEIAANAQELADRGALGSNAIVFHCSGAMTSEILAPVRSKGAVVASVHPIRSFADLKIAVQEFAGTACSIEGDQRAVEYLQGFFSALGGSVFPIATGAKMLLHAGHVFTSNYLVALIESGQRLYRSAGVPDEISCKIMAPLVKGTVENVLKLGTVRALTGPISRGEEPLVRQQLSEVAAVDRALGEIYVALGRVALELAREQGLSNKEVTSMKAALGIAIDT